jgi:acetylornithine deacetylase
VCPDTGIEFDALSALAGFDTQDGSAITVLAKECNGSHHVGKVSFGTEAALFDGAKVPTVICGPGHIAQAHQPNEWVALEQLARCETFMRHLVDHVAA